MGVKHSRFCSFDTALERKWEESELWLLEGGVSTWKEGNHIERKELKVANTL